MRTPPFALAVLVLVAITLTACGSSSSQAIGPTADPAAQAPATASVVNNRSSDNNRGSDNNRSSDSDRPPLQSILDGGELVLPDGWFELSGYGTILHVDGEIVEPYYVTRSTCTVGEAFDNLLDVDHASDDGSIVFDLVGPTTDYRLLSLTDRPQACDGDAGSSLLAFEELFTSHYPFFDERTMDWPAALASVRTTVDTDPSAFDEALTDFMVELGDGHTTLDSIDIDPSPEAFGVDGIDSMADIEALIGDEIADTLDRLEDFQFDQSGTVGWGHLTDGNGIGHSTGGIGYLLIGGFEGLTPSGEPVADRDALVAALDVAIAELAGRFDSAIIDMRFNPGGYEDLAITAAGYFIDSPADAYRKWAHAQPDRIAQTVAVTPADVTFDGDLAVLVSPLTASAAEAFLLAIRQTSEATLIGSPSFGEFSDAIDWVLPNRTEFTLSMEVYTDLAGTNYEARGVPVDVDTPFDQTLETAVGLLADRR